MSSAPFGMLSWNWCVWTANRDRHKLALLDRLDWSIAALQETAPESIRRIAEHLGEVDIASGCDLAATEHGVDPSYGCSIITRNGAHIIGSGLVPLDHTTPGRLPGSEPLPESVLWARVRMADGTEVLAVSAHPPHAAGRGDDRHRRVERKVRTYRALETWLHDQTEPIVIGLDGNSWIDGGVDDLYGTPTTRPDPQQEIGRFFHDGPSRHGLRDVYRDWLTRNPARLEAVQRRRPVGPLAVTFVRGTTRKGADRFDAIMASTRLRVHHVEHSYGDAVSAGSDHSYVLATLQLDR